jgi:hypothetical protein
VPTDSMPDLSWLADSPVFIDGQQVGAFYDAVVGPAFRAVELQVTASWAEQLEKSTAGHLNAGLSALFPWLRIDAGVEARKAVTPARQDGQSVTLQPVDSAARQLALHYLVNQPERICVVNQNTPFPGAEAIAASPRMIAFVDVPPGTRFLPQAAELNDGRVVTFFSPLIEKLKRDGGTLPGGLSRNHDNGRGQATARCLLALVHRPLERRQGGLGRGGCHRRRRPGPLDRLSRDLRHRPDAAPRCDPPRRLRHRHIRLLLHLHTDAARCSRNIRQKESAGRMWVVLPARLPRS